MILYIDMYILFHLVFLLHHCEHSASNFLWNLERIELQQDEGQDGHFGQFSEFRFSQGPDIKCIIWPNFKDQNEWCLQMRKKEKSETYLSKLQKTDDYGK